jgi:chromosome segregation ATPase
MKRLRRFSTILLPVAIGIAAFWLGRATYSDAEQRARLVQVEEENRKLKSSVEELRSKNAAVQQGPGQTDVRRSGRAPGTSLDRQAALNDAEILRILRENLDSANHAVSESQARAIALQTRLDEVIEEQKRLAASVSDLTGQLESSRRRVEAKEAELGRTIEQLVNLEAANKKLSDEASATGQKAGELLRTSTELQQVYRRLETYLNTVTSRYREVTDQYRAFASVLENRRGPEGTPGAGISIAGPELTRIQNSIALAEEDLRQINALNVQAIRLQKRLSGK